MNNYQKGENIINNLIVVSRNPFNIDYFYKLKNLFADINYDYSKLSSNISQEFVNDLINNITNQLNEPKGDIYYLINQKSRLLSNSIL